LRRWHTAARIPVGRDRLPHQARTSRPDWRTYWTLQPRLRVRTRPRLRHAYDRRRRIMKKTRSHETSEGRGAGDQPDRQRERRLRKPSGDAGAQPTDPSILFACPFRHDTTLRAARLPSITAHVTKTLSCPRTAELRRTLSARSSEYKAPATVLGSPAG